MIETVRLLVTGARSVTSAQEAGVRGTLRRLCAPALARNVQIVVVQGECPYGGVDLVARSWAEETDGAASEGHLADWARRGRGAGMIRNSHMVSLGAHLCAAFPAPSSRGTWDCLRKAADAGIPVRIYPLVAWDLSEAPDDGAP